MTIYVGIAQSHSLDATLQLTFFTALTKKFY